MLVVHLYEQIPNIFDVWRLVLGLCVVIIGIRPVLWKLRVV